MGVGLDFNGHKIERFFFLEMVVVNSSIKPKPENCE